MYSVGKNKHIRCIVHRLYTDVYALYLLPVNKYERNLRRMQNQDLIQVATQVSRKSTANGFSFFEKEEIKLFNEA